MRSLTPACILLTPVSCFSAAHKIIVVIEPLLIDEDYYARVDGREIISNLAKVRHLATLPSHVAASRYATARVTARVHVTACLGL